MAHVMNKISCFLFFLFNFLTNICYADSFLNIEELSSLKYGLQITNKPVLFQEVSAPNELHVSSRHGQAYSCVLPEVLSNQEDEKEALKKENDDVVKILDKSLNGSCLTYHKGWWSYKVCHKKKIQQYHMNEKGEVDGDITLLGVYQSEDDWSIKDKSGKKTGNLYHKQTYVNGTKCDLTTKSRSVIVQYYCSSSDANAVIRVEEPSTCEYIITVNSKALCTHTLFKEKVKANEISLVCSPVLKEEDFNKYMEMKKAKEIEKKESMKRSSLDTLLPISDNELDGKKEKTLENTASKVGEFMKGVMSLFGNNKGSFKLTNFKVNLKEKSKNMEISDDTDEEPAEENIKKRTKHNLPLDVVAEKKQNIFSTEDLNEDLEDDIEEKNENLHETKDEHIESKTNSEQYNKFDISDNNDKIIEKEISELQKENDALLAESMQYRHLMNHQYAHVKEIASKELARTKTMIRQLKDLFLKSENEAEKTEVRGKIDRLESYVGLFNQQISTIENNLKNMKELEEEDDNLPFSEIESETIDKPIDFVEEMKKLRAESSEESFEHFGKKDNKKLTKNIVESISKELKLKREKRFEEGLNKLNKAVTEDEDTEEEENTENKIMFNSKDMSKVKESLNKFVKLLEKNVKSLNEKEDIEDPLTDEEREIVESNENLLKDDMQVRIRPIDKNEDIDKQLDDIDQEVGEDVKEATKMMEESVKKQLKEAGLNIGDSIKVKIITSKDQFDEFDSNNKPNKLLTGNEASKFKDMLLGILGGGSGKKNEEKRQKSLESNYNFKWDTSEEDSDNNINDNEEEEESSSEMYFV